MGGYSTDRLERYQLKRIQIARRAGVIMVIVLLAYVILADFSLVPRSIYYQTSTAFSISLFLAGIAFYQLLMKKASLASQSLFILITHVLGGLLLVLVTGFLSPITLLWLLLITIADLLFTRKAALVSIVALYATMAFSIYLAPELSQQLLLLHIFYATAIVAMGWFVGQLRSIQADEHNDLVNTRKREISQQNQLMTLINSMSQAVISITPSGHIQLYNSATLDLLDTNRNLSGRSIDEVFHLVDESSEPVNILMLLEKGGHSIQRSDLSHQHEDGDVVHLDINSSVIYSSDNQVNGRIIILRDITKAKTFDEERDEFISIVSHELRTPITIAEGTISNLQILLDKDAAPNVVRKAIEAAHGQIVYLSKMINDLSTLSRAERGIGDTKELIDLKDMGEHIFNEYSKKAQKHNVELNIDLPSYRLYTFTSRLYLEEILQNLITNAIKYTPKGSVTLAISKANDKFANISVIDTGVGISKSDQKKIFDKFYRSEDYRTRETSGTGLGLYVVSKLARKLKVNVGLKSSISKGSTFYFKLPLASKQQIDKYRSVK